MLEPVALLGFGLLVGFYGTLVGIGGGPLIVPMLALAYDLPPATIVATSLSVVLLNSLSGSLTYYQQRRVDVVSGTVFGTTTIPAAIWAYFLLAKVTHQLFDHVFAFFLLALAILVNLAPGGPRPVPGGAATRYGIWGPLSPRRLRDADGNVYVYAVDELLGNLVSFALGFITTLLGIGGGIFQVPLLVYVLRFPAHVATATAHFITAINSFFTLIPLMFYGHAEPRLVLWLGLGAVVGARVGAICSRRVPSETLLRLLTVVFLATAGWMLRRHGGIM